jgi:hypothetical protein
MPGPKTHEAQIRTFERKQGLPAARDRDAALGADTEAITPSDVGAEEPQKPEEPRGALKDFTLASPAFAPGAAIPARFSRDGGNVSPQLEWSDPPPGTQSLVLMLEDPDAPAPAFRHWVVYDIPPHRRHLPESGSSKAHEEGLPHAVNSFGAARYDGPQPPVGDPPHTYRFRLVALGVASLGLDPQPTAGEVWEAARSQIRGEAELTGTFQAQPESRP